jgi:hypothetical protein
VALEKLATEVKYPCTYRDYGCRETHKLDLIDRHQEECQYFPQQCPVNKLDLGTCIWLGISSKINSHLKQAHSNVCMDYKVRGSYGNRGIVQRVGSYNYPARHIGYNSYDNGGPFQISGVTPTTKHCKLIFAYNDVFYSRSEIKNGIFYSVLHNIGPAAGAVKYQYKLEFFNKEGTERLAVILLPRSWNENLSEVHHSGKYVIFYPEQIGRFVNEESELIFSMEIITL